jgi:L-aspartate oxidase
MRAVIDDGVPDLIAGRAIEVSFGSPASSGGATPRADARERLQRAMTTGAGVLRSAGSLAETAVVVDEVRALHAEVIDSAAAETHNLATVATGILAAATVREESRGAHTRSDFPKLDEAMRVRFVLR